MIFLLNFVKLLLKTYNNIRKVKKYILILEITISNLKNYFLFIIFLKLCLIRYIYYIYYIY